MPVYSVLSLDMQGNIVEGTELNDEHHLGEVYLPPYDGRSVPSDLEIVEALVAANFLDRKALVELEQETLDIDHDLGDEIVLSEEETALAAVDERHQRRDEDRRRYIESERDLEDDEVAEEVTGLMPFMALREKALTWGDQEWHCFWRLDSQEDPPETHALHLRQHRFS